MDSPIDDLLAFIDASPTPYHAVATAIERLEAAGYEELEEGDAWCLEPGARRYVVRGESSLIAFEVGARPPAESGFRLIGAHTDSPNLRIKPHPDVYDHGYHQLAVEPYGGVLLHTWLDRDLSLAGRVFLKSKSKSKGNSARPSSRLIRLDEPLLRIPNLAIHLYREIRTEGLKLNQQRHLVPVAGLGSEASLFGRLAEVLSKKEKRKIAATDILSADLMTFDLQPSVVSGFGGEFIHAPRLDNLASSHAGLCALTQASPGAEATRVVALYDHEEVGSRSAMGAAGPFLADVLARLAAAAGDPTAAPAGAEPLARAVAHSWMISADMAHAVHPNYAERHEPGHRPEIGAGPVLKTNVNQSYATDGAGAALFASLCAEAKVPFQNFVTRSDLGCGSTIGPISAARLGIRTLDIGNPMLSMHSCREMAGSADVEPMIDLLRTFFEAGPLD